jgi:hypothetical protein
VRADIIGADIVRCYVFRVTQSQSQPGKLTRKKSASILIAHLNVHPTLSSSKGFVNGIFNEPMKRTHAECGSYRTSFLGMHSLFICVFLQEFAALLAVCSSKSKLTAFHKNKP